MKMKRQENNHPYGEGSHQERQDQTDYNSNSSNYQARQQNPYNYGQESFQNGPYQQDSYQENT